MRSGIPQPPYGSLCGLICLVLLAAIVWAVSIGAACAQEPPPYVPGEILVKFKDGTFARQGDRRTRAALEERRVLQALGLRVDRHWPELGIHRGRLEAGVTMEEALQNLRSRPDVEFAEPNYLRHKLEIVPNDPYYGEQWALEKMGMPLAWEVSTGSEGILLAVVDSGVDFGHEDLAGKIWKNPGEVCGNGWDDDHDGYVDDCYGVNVITGRGDPMDDDGHGTHLAGTAAAVGYNGRGMAGVDWHTKILPIKFLGEGGGNVADFVEAVSFAKARGVRVMNMSFGAYSYSEAEKQAIAGAPNILFVAAAGNERYDNDFHPLYPASYDLPNLISVASSNKSDKLSVFSNYGVQTVHVAAPGENILGTLPGNDYDNLTGTSMSTALVSGLAALIFSMYPSATPAAVKGRILRTADQNDALQGILSKGRVNAYRALVEPVAGPYIFRLIPDSGPAGSQVVIRGCSFGRSPGAVRFSANVPAEIISWADEVIVVKVPDGAIPGGVVVHTADGAESNGAFFTVTAKIAGGLRFVFPEIRANPSHVPILVLSNPSKDPALVHLRVIEATSRTKTLKVIHLEGLEKWIENLSGYAPRPEQLLMVDCQSESLVGAAVVTFREDMRSIYVAPLIKAQPTDFEEVSPR
ncbi:MAG: S8 family serine peptidase [Desulfosoma sp.]